MQIDFYILDDTSSQKSLFFACGLIEKLHQKQRRIYIHAQSRHEAERIDALLWTYRDDSFLPHNLYHPSDDFPPSIQIGFDDTASESSHEVSRCASNDTENSDVLLNLSHELPPFYKHFQQVIEIVFSDPLTQQLARERYKHYREQGYEITTHKLKANQI